MVFIQHTPLKRRFHQRVEIDHASGCWLWTGSRDAYGYGTFRSKGKAIKAHRYGYRIYMGEIPEGLVIDHLCRVKLCVNPEHLEPVTASENSRRQLAAVGHHNSRKTHCRHGHPFSGDNLRTSARGRACRACEIAAKQRWQAKQEAAS